MTVLTDAYVLRKSQRGDFDRQYVLFTKDLGKINVLAKGAMKISSKLASHLDFFYLTEVMVAPGQAIYRLAGAKIKTVHLKGNSNLLKQNIACFFLETTDILMVEKNPDAVVFDILNDFFSALSDAINNRELHLILNQSLYRLLSHLGYQPKLGAKNQSQLTNDLHRLIMEAGEKEVKSFGSLQRELLYI